MRQNILEYSTFFLVEGISVLLIGSPMIHDGDLREILVKNVESFPGRMVRDDMETSSRRETNARQDGELPHPVGMRRDRFIVTINRRSGTGTSPRRRKNDGKVRLVPSQRSSREIFFSWQALPMHCCTGKSIAWVYDSSRRCSLTHKKDLETPPCKIPEENASFFHASRRVGKFQMKMNHVVLSLCFLHEKCAFLGNDKKL